MKSFFLFSGFCLLIVSCGNAPVAVDDPIEFLEPDDTSSNGLMNDTKNQGRVFPIDSFPKEWYMLSMPGDDTAPFLQQWCDASIPRIILEEGDKAYEFIYDSGQERETWDVELFQAFAFHTSQGDSIAGEIQIMNRLDEDSWLSVVSFSWEPYKNYCYFSGEPTAGTYYVNKEEYDSFELVEQDCEEMW